MRKKDRQKAFLANLKDGKGIICYACDKTGISRQTYYDWIKADAKFKAKVDEINEETLDVVESKLLTAISNDDLTAILFYLKTKGKSRGYSEQIDNRITFNQFEELMRSLPDEDDA